MTSERTETHTGDRLWKPWYTKGKLEHFFLSAYLEESETHQHLDPSKSNLRTSMKTANLGQGMSWVWSFWTSHRRSWMDKPFLLQPLSLQCFCVTSCNSTMVCSVCSLQAPAQVLSCHRGGTQHQSQVGPCIPLRWITNTLCAVHMIACHWRSPECWIHQLLDLINTAEKEGMVFWFLLFWPRRKSHKHCIWEEKINKPILPPQNQTNVSCITLFSKWVKSGLDLHDLFPMYVFESEFPVAKFWLTSLPRAPSSSFEFPGNVGDFFFIYKLNISEASGTPELWTVAMETHININIIELCPSP